MAVRTPLLETEPPDGDLGNHPLSTNHVPTTSARVSKSYSWANLLSSVLICSDQSSCVSFVFFFNHSYMHCFPTLLRRLVQAHFPILLCSLVLFRLSLLLFTWFPPFLVPLILPLLRLLYIPGGKGVHGRTHGNDHVKVAMARWDVGKGEVGKGAVARACVVVVGDIGNDRQRNATEQNRKQERKGMRREMR